MNDEQMKLVADIVAAYVSNNHVAVADIAGLVQSVNTALAGLGSEKTEAAPEAQKPFMPWKKSITPDFIISLEDGRKFKSMKRHLAIKGMTPEQYRTKWGLPKDYPMVAPNYAAARSALAQAAGLGKGGRRPAKK